MRGASGQVSVEYIIIVGFSLLLLAPLLLLYSSQTDRVQAEFADTQARLLGQVMADSAQTMYYAGAPNKQTVRVRIPEGVESFEITNNSIVLHINKIYEYDMLIPVDAVLIPTTLTTAAGPQDYSVEARVGGVLITEA